MSHAFLLIVYLGTRIISNDMYFNNIDNCKYFADRFNNQPSVPNPASGEDGPKTRSYVAVCEPKRISKAQQRYN